jgi:hypothetical protein
MLAALFSCGNLFCRAVIRLSWPWNLGLGFDRVSYKPAQYATARRDSKNRPESTANEKQAYYRSDRRADKDSHFRMVVITHKNPELFCKLL